MAKRAGKSSPVARPHVVAIGASAGGITALQELFSGFRTRPGFAVVVIQHLAPGKPSRLIEFLRRWCSLPVHEASAGVRLKRGNVYVACPNDVLTLHEGLFCTQSREDGQHRPGIDTIDSFFESLARDCGSRAIAVVLSGSGADGAAGAMCIKKAGGLVIVQDPLTAEHDSMPSAAIGYGTADYILPLSGIAEQLRLCTSRSYQRPTSAVSQTTEVTRALDSILVLMREQAGVDLSGYKSSPLLWRIQQRMDARRVQLHEDYESLLRDDPGELEALVRGIPIHVTEFFRDPSAWQVLNDEVIDLLSKDRPPGEPIRAWTPACATGEEAYSVAMLLSERARSAGQDFDFQVFATDASAEIVARASRGAFRAEKLSRFPPQRKARFFHEADAVCRIKRKLRDKMVFATQDLLTDSPFTNFDLVTCRNLLIYLDRDASQRVLYMLHSSLRVGGYLFLGRGEALPPGQQGFKAVSARWRIYRKEGPLSDAPVRFAPGAKRTRAVAPAARADASTRPSPREWSDAVRVSNEQLDASHEERQALNEELDSSNEQLNIANEGLSAANGQLQERVAELAMQGRVLSSGEVATLFLDHDLRVRWFTPATSDLFPLRPADAGRRITDLIPRFEDENFIADVQQVMQTGEPREAEVRNREGRWFLRRVLPYLGDRDVSGVAITFADISVRRRAEGEIRLSEALVAAQKEAFQSAVSGAPLRTSLDLLVSAAITHMGEGVRCGFYVANGAGRELYHITGMPEEYRICVDGFRIGPDSFGCGLAVHTGQPVITPDVALEPRWKEWLHLSARFSFRGCWSFPLKTTAARIIGTFAVYHAEPREATSRDLEYARLLTRTAGVIIARHQEGEKRTDAEVALRESRAELTRELEIARARLEVTG